ncbi:hypothetical protein C8R43DRAFT_1032938 [Mycena crocata]|nr:hypothetical protein C8R43DRAFT_1032938 [Mycena crocata]
MASLIIECGLECDKKMGRSPGILTLTRVACETPGDHTESWAVKEVKLLRTSERSAVFRADLYRPGAAPLDVVLKLDPTGERRQAFQKEAEAYRNCDKDLLGLIFPEYHGCFEVKIGINIVACVVTEYCGNALEQSLDRADRTFLRELFLSVEIMHSRGMKHGDLFERNILVCDGHPVIIDLESVEPHRCGIRMKTVPGATMPTEEEYGCTEMYDLADRIGVWKPETVPFCTIGILKHTIASADDIKHFIPSYCRIDGWRENLEAEADTLYAELCEERRRTYGTDVLEDCKKRVDFLPEV